MRVVPIRGAVEILHAPREILLAELGAPLIDPVQARERLLTSLAFCGLLLTLRLTVQSDGV